MGWYRRYHRLQSTDCFTDSIHWPEVAASLQPCIAPGTIDVQAPVESQGRGFEHGHGKGHDLAGATMKWLRKAVGGDLSQRNSSRQCSRGRHGCFLASFLERLYKFKIRFMVSSGQQLTEVWAEHKDALMFLLRRYRKLFLNVASIGAVCSQP